MAFLPYWRNVTASFALVLGMCGARGDADVSTRSLDSRVAPFTIIEITGEIKADDVAQIEALLEEGKRLRGQYGDILNFFEAHLNSPGGSFKAGIDIARLFNRYQVPTKVNAGSECLSACAVIFMSGYWAGYEGPNTRARHVVWPARLGFHRPFLGKVNPVITPGVLAQTNPDELAAIFAEEFFAAFDAGNALIQEMLEVDPGAWSTELLVDMLTATSQGTNAAFVYLESVEDALSWDITVGGVVAAPRDTREDRFELALAACFNVGRHMDIGKSIIWPDASDLQGHRDYNIDRERWRPGTTFREGDEVIDIRWYLWEALDGCTVSLADGNESVDIDGTRHPMPQGLMQWAPEVSLDTATGSAARQRTCNEQGGTQGTCIVIRGRSVTDKEQCLKSTGKDSLGAPLQRFCWPSGSVTTLQERAGGALINGSLAKIVSPVPKGMDHCHLNRNTGNTFCFGME